MYIFQKHRYSINFTSILIFIIILLSIFFGCNSRNINKISVGYMPIAECLPLFLAVEKGYFKEEGLEIELLQFPGGSAILEAMISNNVDFGFSNVVSLIYSRQGKKDFVSVWGATLENSDHILHGIVVIKNKISSPKELLNKTIAVNTLRNIDDLLILQWLKKYNINRDDISILEVPFPRMNSVLKKGDVDAIAVVEPFLTIAREDTNCKVLGEYFLRDNKETLITTYCSSSKWLSKNNDKLSKFRAAMNKAIDYYSLNSESSRNALLKYTKLTEDVINKINLPIFRKTIPTQEELDYFIDLMKKENWLDNVIDSREIRYE